MAFIVFGPPTPTEKPGTAGLLAPPEPFGLWVDDSVEEVVEKLKADPFARFTHKTLSNEERAALMNPENAEEERRRAADEQEKGQKKEPPRDLLFPLASATYGKREPRTPPPERGPVHEYYVNRDRVLYVAESPPT